MSETTTPSGQVIPSIRNASVLRLKLLALKPQETLDVSPQDLPKSHKSPARLIRSIRKSYGYHFVVMRVAGSPGWRVLRVSNEDEVANHVPEPRALRSLRLEEPLRIYNMSDGALTELVDQRIMSARKDIALLAPRGVTTAFLNTLEADNAAFKNTEEDVEVLGLGSIAMEEKVSVRDGLLDRLISLGNIAANAFGRGTSSWRAFRLEALTEHEDADLFFTARRAWIEGTLRQPDLAAWGGTLAFLSDLKDRIDLFGEKIDDLGTAKAERIKATPLRTALGNSIYTRLEKLCNTGKDVFRTISEAKYNDYYLSK